MKKTNQVANVGLLVGLSIIGKLLSITVGPFRFSFENLPIIVAGIMFGPITGGLTGGLSDIVGCVLIGYAINPIITLGALLIGLICGFVYSKTSSVFWSVLLAHVVGSMIIKSLGLYILYGYPLKLLMCRVPQYLLAALVEFFILKKLLPAFRSHF